MKSIDGVIISCAVILVIVMISIVVYLEIEDNATDKFVHPPQCLEYNNLRQIYYNRLDQLRVGEINHKQYRDSVYTDFENYMIKNKN